MARKKFITHTEATTSIDILGNAGTATKLKNYVQINGLSFNGSVGLIADPLIEQDLSTNATRYLSFVDSTTATYQRLNVDDTLNYNPSTGALSATIFKGTLDGTAILASKLSSPRTISLNGDVTGSVNFDGSSNITITATVMDDSHNHTSSNISDATNSNTANMIVKRDASGNFSAGTITATLSGNATTAYGLNVHTGRNNEANKVVRTDGNGYLQVGYINCSNGDENINSNPDRVWGTNGSDQYMRTYRTSALSVGTSQYSTYLWSTSHSGSYYIKNWWTGNYWRIDSNHPSGCSVAHADYANSAETATKINPLSGDANYKLCYTADGQRTNPGEWGRAVMRYEPNGQTYGIRVDRADYADSAGNASTATTLQTARTINGVSFNGSANITIYDSTKASLASPAFTGTPTAPTAATGTNTTQLATTAFVQATKIEIGVGQTWKNVTASRSQGVTYTNSTGRSIMVSVAFGSNNTTETYIIVDGNVGPGDVGYTSSAYVTSVTAIIPNGSTYSVNYLQSAYKWLELR